MNERPSSIFIGFLDEYTNPLREHKRIDNEWKAGEQRSVIAADWKFSTYFSPGIRVITSIRYLTGNDHSFRSMVTKFRQIGEWTKF